MKRLSIVAVLFLGLNGSLVSASQQISEIISACLDSSDEGRFIPRKKNQKATDYVGVEDGRIVIKAELQLRYQHYFTQQELTEAIRLVDQVRPYVERIYARNGIDLRLTLYHAPYDPVAMNPHPTPPGNAYVVYVRRDTGDHMNSLFWGVNADWDAKSRGSIYAHEFAHKLDLKDEYDTLLAERIGEADNIMRDWKAAGAKFYPHQIKTMISPLCSS